MSQKKGMNLQFFSILLVFIVFCVSCGGNYMSPERALRNFSNRIEQGNFDSLTLTIYYMDVSTIRFPITGEELVRLEWYDHKIIVDSDALKKHVELLRQISADNLIPVSHELPVIATLYYVFSVNNQKIFGVVPQPDEVNSSMIINGIEFEWDDVFFDVVRPFLPKDLSWLWDG